MPPKSVDNWSGDEVAVFLGCIGLADKVGPFRENAVDGALLLTLAEDDLTGDLGLSRLQSRKVLQSVEFAQSLSSGSGGGGASDDDLAKELESLQLEQKSWKAERDELHAKIAHLDAKLRETKQQLADSDAALAKATSTAAAYPAAVATPAPAPAPAPAEEHHHRRREPGVVGGAARGAAGGAMKGAIAGAILPGMDAGDGAKAGAAVGAATGGGRALMGRRRRRMLR